MDLLERYLAAVARRLPAKQKADVTAELRDVLLTHAEEAEARLGRPLTRQDWERLLVDFGNPVAVAGRYAQVQHLIGPEVFPYWLATVKAAMALVLALYVILSVLTVMGGEEAYAAAHQNSLLTAVLAVFGGITLGFALVERFGKLSVLSRWKPRDLPPVQGRGRGRFDILAEAIVGLVVIAWWTGLIHFGGAVDHLIRPGVLQVHMAQVWRDWFWPILGYLVFEFITNVIALARSAWVRTNGGLRALRNAAGMAMALGVLRAGHWLEVAGPWPASEQATVAANFDNGMRIGLVATVLFFGFLLAWDAWRTRQTLLAMRPLGVVEA